MLNRPWPWIVAVSVALLAAAGCKVYEQNPPAPVPLVSLSVSPADSSVAPGTTVQFTATGTFADNSKRNVTTSVAWDSSDKGIATINTQGLATAVTMTTGSTVISAVSGGITGTTTLTTSHVASIAVTPAAPPCIAPGTTQQFAAGGTLNDGAQQDLTSFATWTSLDTSVATVSDTTGSKGLATAVAPGTANIQATYDSVSSSASLSSSAVASIVTSPTGTSIPKGITEQFTAIGTLSGGCNIQDVTSLATWGTSSTAVATVSDKPGSKGLVTAVDIGTATISATIDAVPSTSATLTVTQPVLESIEVTPSNQSVALGLTQQFIATGIFSDGTKLNITSSVTWNSTDTVVAIVSNATGSNGLATSQSEGTTTITASFSGITSNNAALTITPAELRSIMVTPASANVPLGTTFSFQFSATGTFTDSSTQNLTTSVTWSSSNVFVASISNTSGFQGQANPLNIGTTTITATSGSISGTAVLNVTSF
ncbi:MAG TPA: Ig-like domain-containing protein [Nitrospirota bacterium]|nr:Ig-like domain-containing protein [Nitrospirota bacterium]